MPHTPQNELPEEYKESAKFWNTAWGEDGLFESLPKKVKAELYDFENMISTWSEVTSTITGGKLSYPNYTSQVLVTQWEDYVSEQIQQGIEEELSLHQQQCDKRVEEAEQTMRIRVKQVVGTNAVFLLPSSTERCEGFYKKGLYKAIGIDVTRELLDSLTQKGGN